MHYISLLNNESVTYPRNNIFFRPSVRYPEYPFEQISYEINNVYEMVRECFYLRKMDLENYNTESWNPMRNIIKEGDCVLIKPNLVLHYNLSGCGNECLYTHPSVVAAIIDYVVIALNGNGKIIVGDAPMQECDFDKLINESGYSDLIDFYKNKGIDIEIVDFRNVKTFERNGLHYLQEEEGENGVIVQLNEKSAFNGLNEEHLKNLRITNYDPRVIQKHHDINHHEYNVSKYILNADVIINMPKPKTHRKAGVTISLKNIVGINANKEFLPHHTLGSKAEGGDAYLYSCNYLKKANEILDLRNELVHDGEMDAAAMATKLYEIILKKGQSISKEKYWEGSWYGNDTIWRTIIDLNRILLYADKKGILKKEKQRKMFIVGDMIVSGQKEGPLEPVPFFSGIIAMGEDPMCFDRIICSIMGFDYHDIPSLAFEELSLSEYPISDGDDYTIFSNNLNWNNKSCEQICEKYSLEFEPTMGWVEKLGNKYRQRIFNKIRNFNSKVYIFGAGINGIYAQNMLKENGIEIEGFLDNNSSLWNERITLDKFCINPANISRGSLVVVGVRDKYISEIKEQIELIGGIYVGTINRGY